MDLEKSPNQAAGRFGNLKDFISAYTKSISDSLKLGPELVNNLLGLEINAEFIKILKISDAKLVESYAITNTPANAIVNNEIKDPGSIANTLKNLLKTKQITSKRVALCIPRASAIIKLINVNSRLNVDEIESRVWIEANRLFPNLVGEIYLDFVVTGLSAEDKNQFDIILVACRKDQIKPYLEIMDQADLVPAIIDIDTYVLERALNILIRRAEATKLTWSALNISYSMITLIVVHEGALIYTHELNYDGRIFMQKISKGESISVDELKSILGLQLRHVLQFFYSSRPKIRLDEIVISGDCAAKIPQFSAFIANEISKEIVMANPFEDMKLGPCINAAELAKDAPALMLCCGLAISKV